MIGQFPQFDNNGCSKKQLDNSTGLFIQTYISIEIPTPFQTIQDVKMFLCPRLDTIEECNEVKNCIESKTLVKFLSTTYNITSHINLAFNQIPLSSRTNKLETLANDLKTALTTTLKKSALFIYNNKEEIFQLLDEKRIERVTELKEKRKQANQKYYEKKKSILTSDNDEPKVLTEEEKTQRKQLANKTYYEKKRSEKIVSEKPPVLSEEEKKEKRKEANKRYYENQRHKKVNIELV